MSKGQTLQDPFLNALRKDRIPVSIFLVNGIKLQGQIESFDQYVVLLKNTVSQMVYKHAISTIVPARNPRTGENSTATGYPASNAGTGYPMSGGSFERQNSTSFGTNSFSNSNFGGGNMRGGFTRTPNTNFERQGGFERNNNYQNGGFERQGGFERTSFNGGFDRSSYEERGFDGKTFDKSFDKKPFDDKAFGKDFEDTNFNNDDYDN